VEDLGGARIVRCPRLSRRTARSGRRDRRCGARDRIQRRFGHGGSAVAEADRRQTVGQMIGNERRLDRRAAMRVLLENRGELLLVTGLGSTTWEAAAVGDDDRNCYFWVAMGAAAMVVLGIAMAGSVG